jgi:hypothetical protein
MKLRIKGNSLRLRITPSEMKRLLDTGRVEETIHFGPGADARLTYALEQKPERGPMMARYRPQEITVVVSMAAAGQWAASPEVGLYGEIETSEGVLSVAIEKDFGCLDKSEAENADTFANPKQEAAC